MGSVLPGRSRERIQRILGTRADDAAARVLLRSVIRDPRLVRDFLATEGVGYLRARAGRGWLECLERAIPEILVEVVDGALDVHHGPLLSFLGTPASTARALAALEDYFHRGNPGNPQLLLRQERAARILAEIYQGAPSGLRPPRNPRDPPEVTKLKGAFAKGKEEARAALAEYYLGAVNAREILDFQQSIARSLGRLASPPARPLRMARADRDRVFHSSSGQRLGLTSANASDNHTQSKERGSKAANVAIGRFVHVSVRRIDERVILLESHDRIETDRPKEARITRGNVREFFAVRKGSPLTVETAFRDDEDPLIFPKYALAYTGIVRYKEDPGAYIKNPPRVLEDIEGFTGGGGLHVIIRNTGQSRAGFASSSAVALNLLNALYFISRQKKRMRYPNLQGLALVFENELGLKSGWQDVYGPLAGVKKFYTKPCNDLPRPVLKRIRVNEKRFAENLILFHTGIQRMASRRLNARHDAYLSREPKRFGAILESLRIHDRIVEAIERERYPLLGRLLTRYMELRAAIDPDALTPTLWRFFRGLSRKGLIHGGSLTGAMGGGFAMLVPTEKGKKSIAGEDRTRLEAELDRLTRTKSFRKGYRYRYEINPRGIERWTDRVE